MQLVELMHIRQNAQEMQKTMITQLPKYLDQTLGESLINDPDLTAAERKEAVAQAKKSANRTFKRFEELYAKKIDVPEVAEEITIDLYDKNYTAEEITDLITFYKSPTGQKTITVMPKLMQDAMQIQMQRIAPVVQSIMQQVTKEEADRVKQELAAPAKKTTPAKKAAVKKAPAK